MELRSRCLRPSRLHFPPRCRDCGKQKRKFWTHPIERYAGRSCHPGWRNTRTPRDSRCHTARLRHSGGKQAHPPCPASLTTNGRSCGGPRNYMQAKSVSWGRQKASASGIPSPRASAIVPYAGLRHAQTLHRRQPSVHFRARAPIVQALEIGWKRFVRPRLRNRPSCRRCATTFLPAAMRFSRQCKSITLSFGLGTVRRRARCRRCLAVTRMSSINDITRTMI
jgi:hypothetical protein